MSNMLFFFIRLNININNKVSKCYLCEAITFVKVAKFALCFSFSSPADIRSLSRTSLLSETLVFGSSLFSDNSLQPHTKPKHKSISLMAFNKQKYTYFSRFFLRVPLILPFPLIGLIFYLMITLRNNPSHHRM